jgi:uncharacterized membrane protein YfcA
MAILTTALAWAAVAGLLDRQYLTWAVIALPTTIAGARIGLLLYGRIGDVGFRRLVLILLGFSGVTLIVTGLR